MEKMQIINCTPHVVRIFNESDTRYDKYARKRILIKKNAKPIVEIPTSGIILSVTKKVKRVGEIDGIPICELEPQLPQKMLEVLKLDEGVLLVVSTLFALACQQKDLKEFRNRLLTIGSPVYFDEKLVGCLSLVKTY